MNIDVGARPFRLRGAPQRRSGATAAGRFSVAFASRRRSGLKPALQPEGFTLIELLVVISIIGVLASLTVGLSGVASRKSKESRLRGDLNRLATSIENYKAALGMFPPDNPGRPSTNQLFYELSGTIFDSSGGPGFFITPNQKQRMDAPSIAQVFSARGFANSVRHGDTPKFTEEFKPSQYGVIGGEIEVEVLVSPVKGPDLFLYQGRSVPLAIPVRGNPKNKLNPWLYDSSSPNRNNRNTFDLWTEVIIGRNLIRFSNWEKEPVVIGRAR